MGFYSKFYSGNYKMYLIVPVILFLICFALIFGVGVKKGIDLSGGTLLTIYTTQELSSNDVKSYLETNFNLEEVSVTFSQGVESNRLDIQYLQEKNMSALKEEISNLKNIDDQVLAVTSIKNYLSNKNFDLTLVSNNEYKSWTEALDLYLNNEKNKNINSILDSLSSKFNLDVSDLAIKEISPTLSQSFYTKAIWVSLAAIIGIIIVVFLAFREFIPSLAIVLCAILDVLGGLAGMAVFGIPLSLVTIPALLMLLGYSIDTDVMLTTKLIKRKEGHPKDRASDSMRTGVAMTTTTLGALIVMLIFSWLYNVSVFFDIALVLIFGLVIDLLATWLMNGPILLWYVESKK